MRVNKPKHGGIIILVTLALFAMAGVLGLAVDLGTSFFIEKDTQAAADAAAMAVAIEAFEIGGATGPYDCDKQGGPNSTTIKCLGTATPCAATPPVPPLTTTDAGCLYAEENGFTFGGDAGRQGVTIESAAGGGNAVINAPVVGTMPVFFWARSRVTQRMPQLFSSMLGNTSALVSSRATAAIVDSVVIGSLLLLNRRNDCVPIGGGPLSSGCGLDLLVSANDNGGQLALDVAGGIIMSSTQDGTGAGPQPPFAAINKGSGTVKSDFANIRLTGDYDQVGNGGQFLPLPTNGHSGPIFSDPTRGKPDPPVAGQGVLPLKDYPGGAIAGSVDPNTPTPVSSGIHYPTFVDNNGNKTATGQPLTITGYVEFIPAPGETFADFIFPGGIDIAGANTKVDFGPGRYVFAGAKPKSNGSPSPLFNISSNAVVTDNSPYNVKPANGGELIIFAGKNYPGVQAAIQNPCQTCGGNLTDHGLLGELQSMDFGTSGIKGGEKPGVEINLHGLNADAANVPAELAPYKSIVMWQDRDNSVYKYDDATNDYQPEPATGCDSLAGNPACETGINDAASTELQIGASPDLHLWGVVYQPRGAFTTMIGGGGYDGPLQLVTGALHIQGNAQLDLGILSDPLKIKTIALIE